MAADHTRTLSSAGADLPEGIEQIGGLAHRHVQQRLSAPIQQQLLDPTGQPRSNTPHATPAASHPGSCLHCAGERARFYRPGAPEDRQHITSPEAAVEILVPMLQGLDREHCITLNLDTKHRLIATTTVSIGSIGHTFMSPREVYRDALLHGAAAIVIAHDHPSGDAEPSRDDELVTRRLHQAGEIVGVDALDHIVIGHDRWVSLARRGVLIELCDQERSESVALGRPRSRS